MLAVDAGAKVGNGGQMSKQAVLLVNLGSPDSPKVEDVREYLHEFLTDERVIDRPFVRRVVVPGLILRTRPAKSAEAYASIWGEDGSPLIAISERQRTLLQAQIDIPVYLAMRYANPSIADEVRKMIADGIEHVFLMPLYPHYAMSSYETVVVRVMEAVREQGGRLRVDTLQPFYDHPEYIEALDACTRPYLDAPYDKLIFSYHGVPERHLRINDPSSAHCLCSADCCETANPAHATCYRHQCFTTTRLLAERLGVPEEKCFNSFQSRLGRDPWLAPSTDETLRRFAREGIKRVRILCPAFVTDCLETLEEIAMEGKETFLESGGEDFEVIPCLNEHPGLITFLKNRVGEWQSGLPSVPPRGPVATVT